MNDQTDLERWERRCARDELDNEGHEYWREVAIIERAWRRRLERERNHLQACVNRYAEKDGDAIVRNLAPIAEAARTIDNLRERLAAAERDRNELQEDFAKQVAYYYNSIGERLAAAERRAEEAERSDAESLAMYRSARDRAEEAERDLRTEQEEHRVTAQQFGATVKQLRDQLDKDVAAAFADGLFKAAELTREESLRWQDLKQGTLENAFWEFAEKLDERAAKENPR